MKVGIATTLSIAGVLAAGAAAFAVNTSVLGSASTTASSVMGSTAALVADQVATPINPATVGEQSTPPVVNSSVVSTKVTTYQVGTSGSVVIDTTSGAIVVTNVLPAAGWTSEPAQTEPNGDVKIHFVSKTARIEFVAKIANGKVEISAINDTPAVVHTPTNSAASTPAINPTKPSVPFAGGDDDDEHDDNEHESGERERDGDDD